MIFHEFIVSRFDPWTGGASSAPSPVVTSPSPRTALASPRAVAPYPPAVMSPLAAPDPPAALASPRAMPYPPAVISPPAVTPPPAMKSPLAVLYPPAMMSPPAVTPPRIGPFSSPPRSTATPSNTTPPKTRKTYDPLGWEILQGLFESSKYSDPGKFANCLLLCQDSKQRGPTGICRYTLLTDLFYSSLTYCQ